MKLDVKTNINLAEVVSAQSRTAGTVNSTAVDMSLYGSVSFLISVGTVGSSATLDAKLQYSSDNSTFTDEASGAGNDTAITQITAAGSAKLHVVNPRARYYRVAVTTATAAVVYSVAAAAGPKFSA